MRGFGESRSSEVLSAVTIHSNFYPIALILTIEFSGSRSPSGADLIDFPNIRGLTLSTDGSRVWLR